MCGLDHLGFESWQKQETFPLLQNCTLAVGPTQPPVPLVPELLPGSQAARAKPTTHLPLVSGLRMC